MAAEVTVDVSDVRRAFARIEPVFREEINDAIDSGAQDVLRIAKQLAPRGATGFLRLYLNYTLDPKTSTARVGIRAGRSSRQAKNSASRYPSVYGRFVHEGTKHQPGNPFMLRAAELSRSSVQSHYTQALNRAAKELNLEYRSAGGASK